MAVEPTAARLGATKGSFYWHFRNRDALVAAALALWEEEHTEAVIAALDHLTDPVERLRHLLRLVMASAVDDRIEVALAASATNPVVAPVLQRVTRRRIDHVAGLFGQLGLAPDAARQRAVFAVSTYLGHLQLAHVTPGLLPQDPIAWSAHLDRIIEALIQR